MNSDSLRRFSEVVLALNDCQSPENLEPAMVAAMRALLDADFHVVNSIGNPRFDLLATTKVFTDSQFETFNAHLSEHPSLWIVGTAQQEKRAVSARWSDRMSLRKFRDKALYHDFFRVVDTQHH